MSFTIKLLKLGLKSSVSSTSAYIGDEVSKCLLRLVGFQSSKERKEEELRKWTQDVSAQLNILNRMVSDISNQISDGFNTMTEQHFYQSYESLYNLSRPHRINIDYMYDKLIEIIRGNYQSAEELKKVIHNFEILSSQKELVTSTQNIADIWGADKSQTIKNLLEIYTDTCIMAMGDSGTTILRDYGNLEYNFLLGMNSLLKAYTIMTTLRNYKSGVNIDDTDLETTKWLESEVEKNIKPIGESFLECTERLILSTYRPDLPNKEFFVSPIPDIFTIGTRSELYYFQTTNMDEDSLNPGLIAKEYLKPSRLTDSKGSLKLTFPGSKEVSVEGIRFEPPQKYCNGIMMSHWYKIIDKTTDGALLSFEDSDIVIMKYKYKYTEYENMSSPFQAKSTYNSTKSDMWYKYYNPETLENVSKSDPNAIAIAYFSNMSDLSAFDNNYQDFPLSYTSESFPPYKFDNEDSFNELKKHAINNSISINGPKPNSSEIISVECSFSADLFSKKHNISFITKYPLKYASKSIKGTHISGFSGEKNNSMRLLLAHKTHLTINVEDYKSHSYAMRACDVEIDIYASNNKKKTKYFNHIYENNTHINNVPVNFQTDENEYFRNGSSLSLDKNIMGIPMNIGSETEVNWEVKILIQTHDGGGNNKNNYIKCSISLEGRFAWIMPKLK